ncbi:MAG: hypothetical protein F6K11_21690 [Leptolyngbya sp. SIO3F4]|nr:hypothetical protein [Leptolyngbya sp. SIO3F4]
MVQSDLRTKLSPLENGDHLNRYEFERRHNAIPHLKKNKLSTWFSLQDGECVPLPKNVDGLICSHQFPSLWLAIDDLLVGNMASVLTNLQRGLTLPDHRALVQKLSKGNLFQ